METPILKTQEIPYDHPDSCNMFQPSADKPFVATRAAISTYREETILACLRTLQDQAKRYDGIDYLQIFQSPEPGKEDLWMIEDSAITALLPSDY